MVALNFSGRFAPMIEARAKRQTIRRKARCKPGDRLQLYTGQRTADCRKLVDPDPICELVNYVALRPDGITVGDVTKHPRDIDEFARADGFRDYADMHAWFAKTYGDPYFTGVLIRWADPASCGEHAEREKPEALRPKAADAVTAKRADAQPETPSHD